jgi:hypothetical protein
MGWNDPAYQAYVNTVEEGDLVLGHNAWNTSKNEDKSGSSDAIVDEDTLNQVIVVGIVAFVGLTALILGVAFIMNRRKMAATTKEYGGVRPGASTNASLEALEGRGGLSADGGIISDSSWDDDVDQLNFEQEDADGFDDMAIKSDGSSKETGSMTYEEESIEAIAGVGSEPSSPPASEASPAETAEMPDEAPPLPDGGLPDGWTMDQWRWYGHEWLDKYGKN